MLVCARADDSDVSSGEVIEAVNPTINAVVVAVPVGIEHALPQMVQVIGPRYREDSALTPPPRSKTGS